MTLKEFQEIIAAGLPLEGDEMIEFMRDQSDESRKIQFELNTVYHTPGEVRDLFSRITAEKADDTFRMFPPFYTDFGRNIHVGKNVFINSCCQFQDQGGIYIGDGCLIGHSVVMATLNHDFAPEKRQNLHHASIRLGKNVWVGAHASILAGVTIGDNSVIAAGAVVSKDVPANEIWGGVPAKFIKKISKQKSMQSLLKEGLTHTSTLIVTKNDTALDMGSGDLPVLATPRLVALMENAAMLSVAQELSEGETTVGGHIHLSHLAPSPVGSKVAATAKLTKVEGHKLHFEIVAFQSDKIVGEATHIRFIVNREKFSNKAVKSVVRQNIQK